MLIIRMLCSGTNTQKVLKHLNVASLQRQMCHRCVGGPGGVSGTVRVKPAAQSQRDAAADSFQEISGCSSEILPEGTRLLGLSRLHVGPPSTQVQQLLR